MHFRHRPVTARRRASAGGMLAGSPPRNHDVRRAGVPRDDIHALRNTAMTNRLEPGVPPHQAQKTAGQSPTEAAIKYQAPVDRAAIDRAREASVRYSKVVTCAGQGPVLRPLNWNHAPLACENRGLWQHGRQLAA